MHASRRGGFARACVLGLAVALPGLSAHALEWNSAEHTLIYGDFNGDGIIDVLRQGQMVDGEQVLSLGLSSAAPTGSTPQERVFAADQWQLPWSGILTTLVAGDFDGDGIDDLLFVPRNYQGLRTLPGAPAYVPRPAYLLYGDKSGQFAARKPVLIDKAPNPAIERGAEFSHYALDMDGDGRADWLAQPSQMGESLQLALSKKNGEFKWNTNPVVQDTFEHSVSSADYLIVPGDYDGDGKDDLLFQSRNEKLDGYMLLAQGHKFSSKKVVLPRQMFGKDWGSDKALLKPLRRSQASDILLRRDLNNRTGDGWATRTDNATARAVTADYNAYCGGETSLMLTADQSVFTTSNILPPCEPPPPTPTGFKGMQTDSNGSVRLWWNAALGATYYVVNDWFSTSSTTLDLLAEYAAMGSSGQRTYNLVACNSGGCSLPTTFKLTVNVVAGTLSGSPNPCVLDSSGTCSMSLSWSTENAPNACLWIRDTGATQDVGPVDCAPSRTGKEISWITANGGRFNLRESNSPTAKVLAYLDVSGRWFVPEAPTLSAEDLEGPGNKDTNSSYKVKWGAMARATGYKLTEQRNSETPVLSVNGNVLEHSPGAKSNATYTYKAQACNAAGCSAESAPFAITVAVPPGPPGKPSGTPNPHSGSIRVSWSAPTSGGTADGYELEESVSGGAWTRLSPNPTTTSQDLSNRDKGLRYNYRVRACFSGICGAYSSDSDSVFPVKPGKPGQPSASPNPHSGSFRVSWSAPTDGGTAKRYELQEAGYDGSNWGAWNTLDPNVTTTYKDLSGKGAGRYKYRVAACNDNDCGIYSDESAPVNPPVPGVPGTPSATPKPHTGSITVSWTAPTSGGAVKDYDLQESSDGGTTWAAAVSSRPTTTSVVLPTRLLKKFIYKVSACNTACGSYSNNSAPTYARPGKPGKTDGTPNPHSGTITLQWSAPTTGGTFDNYEIDESVSGGAWSVMSSKPSSNSMVLAGRDKGLKYSYRVRACVEGDCGDSSEPSDAILPKTPDKPGVPAATPNPHAGSFRVNWLAPSTASGGEAERYELEESVEEGSTWSAWSLVTANNTNGYHDFPAKPLKRFKYHVRACNDGGCGAWSDDSSPVNPPKPGKPGTPGTTTNPHSGSIALSWSAPTDGGAVKNYDLQESIDDGVTWADATPSPLTKPTGSGVTLLSKALKTYRFKVAACNDTGCSSFSDMSVAIGPRPGQPGKPAGSPSPNNGAYTVSWTVPSGGLVIPEYVLQESADGGTTWLSKAPNPTTTSYQIPSNAVGSYVYRVKACLSASNCGDWSETSAPIVVQQQAGDWKDLGQCDGRTGQKTQICASTGDGCVQGALRTVECSKVAGVCQ